MKKIISMVFVVMLVFTAMSSLTISVNAAARPYSMDLNYDRETFVDDEGNVVEKKTDKNIEHEDERSQMLRAHASRMDEMKRNFEAQKKHNQFMTGVVFPIQKVGTILIVCVGLLLMFVIGGNVFSKKNDKEVEVPETEIKTPVNEDLSEI